MNIEAAWQQAANYLIEWNRNMGMLDFLTSLKRNFQSPPELTLGQKLASDLLGRILDACVQGETGNTEKSKTIDGLVNWFRKAGASEDRCDALRKALQNLGSSGKLHAGEDGKTILGAREQIARFLDNRASTAGGPAVPATP